MLVKIVLLKLSLIRTMSGPCTWRLVQLNSLASTKLLQTSITSKFPNLLQNSPHSRLHHTLSKPVFNSHRLTPLCYRLDVIKKFSSGVDIDTGSKEHIQGLVDKSDVVIFMKGVPEQPMCGFSNAVVQILRMHEVTYDAHNVLDDQNLRAGIKEFSEWPTIPQVFFKGEFIGGCDILLQMHQSGDLVDELKNIGIESALIDKDK